MSDLLLLFAGGLLGSAHCVGMCGGFALRLASDAPNWRLNLLRQAGYGGGRLLGYALAGGLAGYLGLRLMQSGTWFMNIQAILAILAGTVLVLQGLLSAGVLRWPRSERSLARGGPCLMGQLFVDLRDAVPSTSAALLKAAWLGILTALMPCGLLYGYLTLAAASGDPLSGLLTMLVFGAGTLPLMTAFGLGIQYLSLSVRQKTLRYAAWCVVATGIISLARGGQALIAGDSRPCPFCRTASP